MFFIHRRTAVLGSAALAAGCGLFLLGTRITTGHFLPTTARAKEIAYDPDHGAAAVAGRMQDLFLSHSFLLPTPSEYLIKLSPLVLVVVAGAFMLAFRYAHSRRERIVLGTLTFATIAIPLAYAYGGVLFSWYLYPANWIAAAVTIAVLVRIASRSRFHVHFALPTAPLRRLVTGGCEKHQRKTALLVFLARQLAQTESVPVEPQRRVDISDADHGVQVFQNISEGPGVLMLTL